MPLGPRWGCLRQNARQPTIGQIVDEAMEAIEGDNLSFRGVLPKDEGVPGFRNPSTTEVIRKHGYVLNPVRYGAAEIQDRDDEPFE